MSLITKDGRVVHVSAESLQDVRVWLCDAHGHRIERVCSANLRTGRVRRISSDGLEYVSFLPAPLKMFDADTGSEIRYMVQLNALKAFKKLAARMSSKWEHLKTKSDRQFAGIRLRSDFGFIQPEMRGLTIMRVNGIDMDRHVPLSLLKEWLHEASVQAQKACKRKP